jgi:hypothetical protein
MIYRAATNHGLRMLLKIIAFISAAIPLILFLRAMFGGRKTKIGATFTEFRKQIDMAIYIFLGLIGCLVAFAFGKLAWTWWTQL